MKSDVATQTFLFNCDGVAAWFDQSLSGTQNALTLLGLNEHVFETAGLDGLTVLQDGCKVFLSVIEMLFVMKFFFFFFFAKVFFLTI